MAVKREKVVQTAEKYVQRGKIDAAIREYRKVLAETPDDATTLNRVGDLYARTERPDEAIKLFTQIAENYTADGFFPKATAIYKKIIKLDPTRLEVYEKLAELYHRQGLLTEARTQYQVLADYYVKHDNSTSAISIYERMAQVDPDDPSLRVRLAELYQQGKLLDKAMAQYRRIAGLMLEHGHPDEAEQVLLKGLDVDPDDLSFITDGVLQLKEAGQVGAAARLLAAAVERNPEAENVARMVGVGPDGPAEAETPVPAAAPDTEVEAEAETPEPQLPELDLPAGEGAEEPMRAALPSPELGDPGAAAADDEVDLVLDADEEPDLSAALESAAGAVEAGDGDDGATATAPGFGDAAALADEEEPGEITLDLDFELDLDDDEIPPSLVQPPADMLEEAEPEAAAPPILSTPDLPEPDLPGSATVPEAGDGSGGIEVEISESTPDADAADGLDLDFLERTASELHPERVQQEEDLVSEAEVLVKYGLTEKAMERISELMQLNPRHPGGMALLIRLHLDEGQYEGAAELATGLCQLAPRSELWLDLWERLERVGFDRTEDGEILPPAGDEAEAAGADEDVDTTPTLEIADISAAPSAAAEAPEIEMPEIDTPEVETTAPADPAPPSRRSTPSQGGRSVDERLASLAAEVLPRSRRPAASTPPPSRAEAAEPAPPPTPEVPSAGPPSQAPAPPIEPTRTAEPSPDWLEETVAEGATSSEGALFSDEDDFFDLAAELEEELSREGELEEDDDLLLEQPREQSLEEIVEGFKKGVSENLSQEDHHTHFDLGIAYREMGLLDEAIGEFQVAAKSPDLLVECCSMLGLSFLEKGLPELAVKWYRRGLDVPGLDEDGQLGLLYDLGNAFMAMGELEEAHEVFVDIYGTNSNYRDVVAKLEETKPGR